MSRRDDFDGAYDRWLEQEPTFGQRPRVPLDERGAVRVRTEERRNKKVVP